MTPKLYKATDVCEIAQLQPYVLRSWEKEFPGIGVQQSPDGPRMYRDVDVEQVQRIKQLVFGEGLTLSGARRRLDDAPTATRSAAPVAAAPAVAPAAPRVAVPQPKVVSSKATASRGDDEMRARLDKVRAGLQSILELLSATPSSVAAEYQLEAPAGSAAPVRARKLATRGAAEKKSAPVAKRKRASA
jgi:DNA-binding transcriptional MerR regulator